jgi:hypothetical protein
MNNPNYGMLKALLIGHGICIECGQLYELSEPSGGVASCGCTQSEWSSLTPHMLIVENLKNQLQQCATAARDEWLEQNDPQDGTDCVTPYDHYFYGMPIRTGVNISEFFKLAEQLKNSYPFLYVEVAHTRTTDYMAWLRTKPKEGLLLAQGQGTTADDACREALKDFYKVKKTIPNEPN